MGIDGFVKRYFAGVICLLIGIAAYFQASGMGQLVVASVALDPSALPTAPGASRAAPHVAPPKDASEHVTSAQAILDRNPFDSVTGPLNAKSIDLPNASKADVAVDENANPYTDPNCDFAKVVLIASSDDPSWSFAILAGSDGKTQMRRQGDDFSGHKVDFVGDRRDDEDRLVDKRDIWDRVWMLTTSSRCQVRVGGPEPKKGASPAPSSSASAGEKHGAKVPSEIASKIHPINDHEFDIERSVVDSILENQALLMRSARVVPEKEGDKVVGIRMFGIRQDSLLGMLGMQNGDRLSSVNGYDMSDPQKALEAYSRLRTADNLTLAINRGGSPMNLDYHIK